MLGLPSALLLHGFTGRGSDWQVLLAALREEAGAEVFGTVLSPDLPGHGEAPPATSWSGTLDHLRLLLDALPRPRVIIGYSLGGRLALALCAEHPGAVDAAVWISARAGLPEEGLRQARRQEDEAWACRLERVGVASFLAEWKAQPLLQSQARWPEPYLSDARRGASEHRAPALAAALRELSLGRMPWYGPELTRLTVPVLVVTGQEDGKFEAAGVEIAALCPSARRLRIADAGHTPHCEQPHRTAHGLWRFLGELNLQTPGGRPSDGGREALLAPMPRPE